MSLFLSLQEYSFQITLRQQWNDNRLAFKNKLTKAGMEGKTAVNCLFAEFEEEKARSILEIGCVTHFFGEE